VSHNRLELPVATALIYKFRDCIEESNKFSRQRLLAGKPVIRLNSF